MAKRSLQTSAEGIRKAKHAFKRKGWTQEYLAAEVGLETRQSIWKFFTGKPIDRHVFHDICLALELDISEIAQKPAIEDFTNIEFGEHTRLDIDTLVQKLRSIHHEKIQSQCGTLYLLDISRPIPLHNIYIDVNICEEISSKRCLDIHNLQKLEFDKLNSFNTQQIPNQQIAGLKALQRYSHLIVLGKPGSGKTTFLQSVALSCNQGLFQPNCLPIFVNLKNFAQDAKDNHQLSLFQYIHEYFINFGIHEIELNTVLSHGRTIILLDGLDEIINDNSEKINHKLCSFINKFYKNQIIISSRTATPYPNFHGFTEVEIADFNQLQIAKFAHKWFLSIAENSPEISQMLANKFIQKLTLAENSDILDLAGNPLFLNLFCLNFQASTDFPSNRFELYKQALDLLLVRWNKIKGFKANEVHPNLSLLDKIKLLSDIAATNFYQKNQFIPENTIRYIIIDYLRHLPHATTDPDALELESLAVLKAIEAEHGLLIERARGIYSFAHVIFQEYLTAREIVSNTNNKILQELVNKLYEQRC